MNNSIFMNYSPMSPRQSENENSIDAQIETLEMDIQWREDQITNLNAEMEDETANLALILDAKERQAIRSRKRKRDECSGCPEVFKNSCLNCKEKFSSKKIKIHHHKIGELKEQIEEIRKNLKTRQDAREAEIAEEARQKRQEAKQEADVKQEIESDYPTSSSEDSSEASSDAGGEVKEEPDIKIEPKEENEGFIGMNNQIKSEPVYMNEPPNTSPSSMESPLSTSDDDMDTTQAQNRNVDDETFRHYEQLLQFDDFQRRGRTEEARNVLDDLLFHF